MQSEIYVKIWRTFVHLTDFEKVENDTEIGLVCILSQNRKIKIKQKNRSNKGTKTKANDSVLA